MNPAEELLFEVLSSGLLPHGPVREKVCAHLDKTRNQTKRTGCAIRSKFGENAWAIVVTTPTQETKFQPEYNSCYLVFDHDVVIRARLYGSLGHSSLGWHFTPVRGFPRAELMLSAWNLEFSDNKFVHYQFCGKNLGLECAINPCPICDGQKPPKPAAEADHVPLGMRPGLDDGNNRWRSERHEDDPLGPQQKEFVKEAGWDTTISNLKLQQKIADHLLERHAIDRTDAMKGGNETPSLKEVIDLINTDESIPYGWALTRNLEDILTAYSALELAKIAQDLRDKGIINEETRKQLCEPWTKISPGRSRWSNR
jgi:hypothetical protein